MNSSEKFFRWYNNKNVVLTLQTMQKIIALCLSKTADRFKFGFTLPNLATICLHKYADAIYYTFIE